MSRCCRPAALFPKIVRVNFVPPGRGRYRRVLADGCRHPSPYFLSSFFSRIGNIGRVRSHAFTVANRGAVTDNTPFFCFCSVQLSLAAHGLVAHCHCSIRVFGHQCRSHDLLSSSPVRLTRRAIEPCFPRVHAPCSFGCRFRSSNPSAPSLCAPRLSRVATEVFVIPASAEIIDRAVSSPLLCFR